MSPPGNATDQGQCDTQRGPPNADATLALGAGYLAYVFFDAANDPRDHYI